MVKKQVQKRNIEEIMKGVVTLGFVYDENKKYPLNVKKGKFKLSRFLKLGKVPQYLAKLKLKKDYESISIEKQRELNQMYANLHGYRIYSVGL